MFLLWEVLINFLQEPLIEVANSWSVVGEMMVPRYRVLAAALPSTHQGGMVSQNTPCSISNVANSLNVLH